MELRVPLRSDEAKRLYRQARAERRTPQDQAAVLLSRALDADDRADRGPHVDERVLNAAGELALT